VTRNPDDYEILDLADATTDQPGSPVRVLPRLDLGQVGSDGPPEDVQVRRPSWRVWAGLILAFCLGITGGAYGFSLRMNAADEAEQAAAANVVAGAVIGRIDPASQIQHLGVMMHNDGPRDIEVLNAHPLGWATHSSRPTIIPSAEWAAVRISVEPFCDSPAPTQLAVQVRTDAGDKTVTIPLPPGGGTLDEALQQVCGTDPGVRYAINAGRVYRLESTEPDTLLMRVELRPAVPAIALEVTAVNASAGGFLATATNLPIVFDPDRRSPNPLDLNWQIASCGATSMLGDVAPQLTVTLPDGTAYRTHVMLPGQAVAMLARFALTACTE
jgi:hypothetical protein